MPKHAGTHHRNESNYYGNAKGYTFDGGHVLNASNLWVSGVKKSSGGKMAKIKSPKSGGKKITG